MVSLSVVVTAYNSGTLLERAVRSVLAQTFNDFEVIVIDDGSERPQRGVELLDTRIRFVSQPNRGVSVARNRGVDLARAPLVAFLDHDDEWLPSKLEAQMELIAKHPDAAFWCTAFTWVSASGEMSSDPSPLSYQGLLSHQTVLLSSAIVRVADYRRIGGQNPLRAQAEDWEMFLALALDSPPPVMAPQRLVRYHLHEDNATRDYRSAAAERFAILDSHARRARRANDTDVLAAGRRGRIRTRELFAYQAVDAVGESLSAGQPRAALSHFLFAVRMCPRVAISAVITSFAVRLARFSVKWASSRRRDRNSAGD